jgi:rSAM/selenodomain-associated transferase 1
MDHANRLNGKSVSDKSVSDKSVNDKSASIRAASNPAIATTTSSCGIAFMAKASAPGRAKTRLVPPLTFEEAAVLNTAFLQDVADNVLLAARAARNAGIAGYAAYGPPGSEDFFRRTLPDAIGLIEAWRPNFGDCLLHTIEEIFARGHASAVVLNSDSPTLPTAFLVETAAALARPGDRAVLGPSSDGGYYLLGLKVAHRHMFENIAWSTVEVARQTLERAREIGLDVHRLPVWYDVDDVDGLRQLRAELSERPDAGRRRPDKNQPHHAVHTAALMNSLWKNHDFNRRAAALFEAEPLRA